MAINFPNSPTLNQTFQAGSNSYIWNGSSWVGYSTSLNINYNAASIIVRDDGANLGATTSINFGTNLTVTYDPSGIATVNATAGGGTQNLNTTLGFGNTSSLGMSVGVVTATSFVGNLTGTATTATTVDITNTNGLTTIYYPTFVENRTNGQILRGDVDLTYRTDTNTLTVPNISATSFSGSGTNLTGLVTSIVAGTNVTVSGSTGQVTINASSGIVTYATSSGISSALTATANVNTSGIITASSFGGSGSALTGLTGAAAGTYGSSTVVPVITVNGNGRITGIGTSAVSGGGGGLTSMPSRVSVAATTTSIAVGATDSNVTITGYKTYSLLKVGVSTAAWVVLYTNATSRTSDAARTQTTDPTPGSGVLAEVITTGISTVVITPAIVGWNDDTTPGTNIYAKVTNLGSATQQITVNLTILKMED